MERIHGASAVESARCQIPEKGYIPFSFSIKILKNTNSGMVEGEERRVAMKHRTTAGDQGSPVLDSIEKVVRESGWVSFHPEHIRPAVLEWSDLPEAQASWDHPPHYFDGGAETVRWIFVLDILNHCFWPDAGKPTWTVQYDGSSHSGYWGLAASLKRAMEEGIPLTEAEFLADISSADLERIFSGEGEIPLFHERLSNLREAGRALQSLWEGDIVHLIEAAQSSAVRAVKLIVSSFPSFRDQPLYNGRMTYFWKRAQIFAADLHAAFEGKAWGEFLDIAELTAFADYKVPQVLRELGVLSYHPDLARKIDSMELLEPGCEEEVEIRAMTVKAVEAFKEPFREVGKDITSIEIDNWLWQLGQLEPFRQRPYHRCRTIYY
jgi:hypothetical protein